MDYNQPKLFRQLLVWQYLHNYQYFVGQPLQPLMQTWTSVFFPDSVWIIFGSKFLSILLVVHYEEFLDIICHGLLYFAILTYIN